MAHSEPPQSVRVRTDEGTEWRYDAIQQAADLYDCNRSDAIAYACEDVGRLIEAAETILRRDDLTVQQRAEIADLLDKGLSSLSMSVKATVEFETG